MRLLYFSTFSSKHQLFYKNPHRANGGDKLFYKVSNYLLSLIADCGAISKRGKLELKL
jgi:hypothetical protein